VQCLQILSDSLLFVLLLVLPVALQQARQQSQRESMMKQLLVSLLLALVPFQSLQAEEKSPVWFNSGMNNRDITFSPDGNLILTTVVAPKNHFSVIAMSENIDGRWSALETAPFSGEFQDIEAAFHPNGDWVYFASKRPKPDRDGTDWDLWRVSYSSDGWGEPEHLGDSVNTDKNEFYPSLTKNGTLYFTATREDSLGHEDLYRSPQSDGRHTLVENVGGPVNSPAYEFNAFIAPDESYLIFGGQLREGEVGGGDLYISHRENGSFKKPALLGSNINTPQLDYCPMVFGDQFYFTSEAPIETDLRSVRNIERWYQSPGNGLGDVYSVPMTDILHHE